MAYPTHVSDHVAPVLCSDISRFAIYPYMLQVSVPSLPDRWQYMMTANRKGDSVRQGQTIGVAIERHRYSIRQRQMIRLIIYAEGLICHITNTDDMT